MSTATAFAIPPRLTARQKEGLRPICLVIASVVNPSFSAARRDRARVVLDRVEIDHIGVGRQLAGLMQRDRVLDQGGIAPP